MPRKSTDVKFTASAGEADWYATPQGCRQTLREFARALKDGTLIRKLQQDALLCEWMEDTGQAAGLPETSKDSG
jgi:hypothetical protein